jgi:ribosomal protein L11 methyltransferase
MPIKRAHINKKVFEVSLGLPRNSKAGIEILKRILINLGLAVEDLIEQEIDGRQTVSFYCPSRRSAELSVIKLSKLKLRGLRVRSDVLYQDDWLTRWKKDWKPFALTKKTDVVPVWCVDDYVIGKRPYIFLDTISSFGTGLHETTRFMAQFVEMLQGKFTSCLDIGTGTGILALVALKGGAKEVHAVDIDEMCIKAANANFKVNGYSGELITLHDVSKFKTKKTFDFVMANLITHDLVRMKQKILSLVKPDGWLAVSGVSLENLPILRQGFSKLPLRCVKIKKGTKWSAVLFKRQGP